MALSILFFISLFASCVKADDNWDDFTNNLATDLMGTVLIEWIKAPLIVLFGERLTKQFLSESISVLDNVIFALSPLGVLTAVVSVIRICGSSSLRAFVGRAQEGPAEAESELLPCVSESTAELFNDGGITRVFGRPKIVEIVAWEDEDRITGKKVTKIGSLKDALYEKAWSCDGKVSPSELPELDIPNLSLNKGIKRRDQFWFHCAAILGGVLQTGTIVYAALTVFVFPEHFKKDDKPVASYAFPLYITGSTLLFIGMFFCAFIMAQSSKEFCLKPEKPSKLYWLQPGNQDVGDQVFNAFLAVKEGPQSSMTKKLRYIKSVRDRRFDRKYIEIYSAIASTILGFICQFVGMRGLHASVILAQLGSTFLMAIIRTCLRTERMAPDENKIREDRELMSYKQQELDCFAFYLENTGSFDLVSLPDRSTPTTSSSFVPRGGAPLARQLIRTRAQLANLTSSRSLNVGWDEMPTWKLAHSLATTIESTMDLMSSWGVDLGKTFEFKLGLLCKGRSPESVTQGPGTYSVGLMRCGDALRWKVEASQLEAILGLWTWSLFKSNDEWRTSTLFRLIGLSEKEASKEETYLYFHKWIFRQTEARLIRSGLVDDSHRLFGFESEGGLPEGKVLVVRTENELETMAAQDIFIHFFREICTHVKDLGGEVDVVSAIHASFSSSSTRIDELVSCFEAHSLGSREDALLCIVPVLRNQNILPDLAADCPKVRQRREQFIRQGRWTDAFALLRWICQRSEGSSFERSVCELGSLCRRALLNNDDSVRKEGFAQLCKLLNSDIREEFLQTQNISLSSDWTTSQHRTEWWSSFTRQLGWTAWSISIKAPGMGFMQPTLISLCVPQSLPGLVCSDQSPEATQAAVLAMQEWLAMRDLEVNRSGESEADQLCFQWAVENDYHALLYFLLLKWVELSERHPAFAQIGYVHAAITGSSLAIQILVRQGADINSLNDDHWPALSSQAAIGNAEAVQLLLDNGADPNGNNKAPQANPLITAAQRGHTVVAEMLLKYGANANIQGPPGATAIWWAMANNNVDLVEMLLVNGAGTESIGFDGLTPLLWATTRENLPILEMLIDHGANINARDMSGRTAMMLAASENFSAPVLQLLRDKKADKDLKDDEGFTAQDLAEQSNCNKALSILNGNHDCQ
ncbi:hypothetical protein N7535_007580 [Penicillium sp. DV-2018c]|nr:hypothetical protein N7535_007580 [Penicillium sp. DV-2018c]